MTLGPHYGSLKSSTLLLFVFLHLHGRRVKIKNTPLFFIHAESFDISVLEARLYEDLQILRLWMRLEIEPSLLCPWHLLETCMD